MYISRPLYRRFFAGSIDHHAAVRWVRCGIYNRLSRGFGFNRRYKQIFASALDRNVLPDRLDDLAASTRGWHQQNRHQAQKSILKSSVLKTGLAFTSFPPDHKYWNSSNKRFGEWLGSFPFRVELIKDSRCLRISTISPDADHQLPHLRTCSALV